MGVAVTFDDENPIVEVEPGAKAVCSVRVENTGMIVDGMLLDVLGEAAEWATVEPAQVNLLPGASSPVKIVFRPPRIASRAPGEVPFGLRVMSQEDPDGSRIEEGVVKVGEFSDVDLSLVPKTSTGRRSARFRVIVENRGNRREDISIDASDADLKLSYRARPTEFSSAPGTATFVRLVTVPRRTFFKGPNRTLPFEVSALPEDGAPIKADGVMLEKQILPGWLLPLFGIAVLAAGLLLALWFVVLRPVVHSAATAAAAAHQAAKSATKSAKSAASSAARPPVQASPAALAVMLPTPTIRTSATELATVTGSFSKGATSGGLPTVIWTSSAPKIAKVSQEGVVTGLKAGSATITATSVTKAPAAPSTTNTSGTAPGSDAPVDLAASRRDPVTASSAVLSGSATVNVVGAVEVTTKAVTEAAVGKSYSTSLSATGGTGAFTWSISAGSLPAGLSLAPADGAITGTPAELGSSSFTVHLADAGPPTQFTIKKLTIKVVKPLVVETSSLPPGTVGGTYQRSLAAIGGTPPYTWAISPGSGSLPAGLSLDPATGAITGTPTSAGASNFMVAVADAAKPGQSSTESLSVNVVSPLVFGTLTLPSAVLNSTYSQALSASGGAQPYTWSLLSGTLPAGLTLNPATGMLAGTPTANGTTTFAVQVADSAQPGLSASRTFTVSVVNGFVGTTSSLPQASVGQPFTATLTAAGGVTPYVWSLQGTLPPGLSLAPGGTITGTPTATGIFPFTVQAVDSGAPPLSVTTSLTITVVSPFKITTASLLEGVTGGSYDQDVDVVGGTAPYTWSVTAGTLPMGLSLNATTGAITGTPVTTGTSAFTVTVTDSGTPTRATASFSTSIAVVEPLIFTEPALPDAVIGAQYGIVQPSHVSGGSGSYFWSITSGILPPGLILDHTTGSIRGVVNSSAATGVQNFTLTIADSKNPAITTSKPESIDVFDPLEVTQPQLTVTAGTSVSQDLSADVSGGRAPYTFNANQIDGLSVSSAGLISGTPDAPCPGGGTTQQIDEGVFQVTCPSTTFHTQLTVTDSDGNSTKVQLTVVASVPPMNFIPADSLPDISDGEGYNVSPFSDGDGPTGGYGPSVNDIGGFSYATSFVSLTGPIIGSANNHGLPCNELGCTGLFGAELTMDSGTGQISGDLGDLIAGTTWTFNVIITDEDPANPANAISTSFQLSITSDA
jgi:putative Ig domain-containing protein/Big-like domain-containing protein